MTLRCIAGVEKPDEGKIVVNGTTFFDSSAHIDLTPQKRKTALLFQNFQLFPNLTVAQNIAAGIDPSLESGKRREIVHEQLERFGIGDFEKRYPLHLSGGQQQRVALARMLAANPGILMLDEPFSALDSHLKSQLEQDLLDLFDTFENSILYVSHDIDEAFRFCDRIAVVEQGHIQEVGSTEQIVRYPKTLATMKLSGCKNTSHARKINAYSFEAVDWGIALTSSNIVPDGLQYIGIRAFYLSRATTQTVNVVPCVVDRISDSRFERTAMVKSAGHLESANRIQWRVDKLDVPESQLPEKGDEVNLFFDPRNIYLVTG
jgi:molybdate transport system ATP-binding protein